MLNDCLLLIRAQPSVSVLLLVYLSDYRVCVSPTFFFYKEINLISTIYYIVKLYSKWSLYL